MRTNKIYILTMLLMLLATSCHQDSDNLMAYDHADNLVFGGAEKSFAEKFKVTWHGLNQYYALWDFEEEQGLDWDKVYAEYLPKFEALDEREKDDPVLDSEVKELLKGMLSPLHDGHFVIEWKNHVSGNNVVYAPSLDRNASRDDIQVSSGFEPELKYYANPKNGEVMLDETGQPIVQEYSTKWNDLKNALTTTKGKGLDYITAEIKRIESLTIPTEMEVFNLQSLKKLNEELGTVLIIGDDKTAIQTYNQLVLKYAYLNVPGLTIVDNGFIENGISVKFALLKGSTGSIAYFYFSDFSLTPYLYAALSDEKFDMENKTTYAHVNGIREVWMNWFSYIQQLHKTGKLDGVIIDVRSNGGGMAYDGRYVAGALLPQGGFHYGYTRFKRGTSRYDYSPLMPSYMDTLEGEHEVINDKPVVLLTNCKSVSMSEMTAQVVKLMPNGTIIGKRTHGGLCGLTSNEENSLNYSGYIGVEGVTPVFGYVPTLASFTMDKQQLEGYGITPDIEVAYDESLFDNNGRDSQLDRALQFIRTGK